MRNKAELKSEMSRIVTIFKINCSRRIQALRQKHKKELLHLAMIKKQADNALIQKPSFGRDGFITFTFGPRTPEHRDGLGRNGYTAQDANHKASENEMETRV